MNGSQSSPMEILFSTEKVTLSFHAVTGAWISCKFDGWEIFDTTDDPHLPFDIKCDGVFIAEQWGCDFCNYQLINDANGNSIILRYAVGKRVGMWNLPPSMAPGNEHAYREFNICVSFLVPNGSTQIRRQITAEFCNHSDMANGIARRFEGFFFPLYNWTVGETRDCVFDMPGSIHLNKILRPRLPYEEASQRLFNRGSSPDEDGGVMTLHNHRAGLTAAIWTESVLTGTFNTLAGDGKHIHVGAYESFAMNIGRATKFVSHENVLTLFHGGVKDALSTFARYIETASPPLNPPEWVQNAVFMEVDTAYLGGFRGLQDKLPRIKEMGINALYLLPVNRGMYAVADHYDIDPDLGTAEELAEMVAAAHAHGIRVLLDLLIVLMREDSQIAKDKPGLFCCDANNHVLPHEAFHNASTDYANPEYRQYISNFAVYCIQNWDVDGFRVDCAVYKSPNWHSSVGKQPWETSIGALGLLNKVNCEIKKVKPDAVLLNETGGPSFFNACDICHNFGIIYQLMDADIRKLYRATDYRNHLADMAAVRPAGALTVLYTRNHDTAWFYRFDGYTPAFFTYEAIHCVVRGIPLFFSGQTGKPEWGGPMDSAFMFYKKLLTIRKQYSIFIHGDCDFDNISCDCPDVFCVERIYHDDCLIALINTSGESVITRIVREKAYGCVHFFDLYSGATLNVEDGARFDVPLEPYGIVLLIPIH